MEKTTFEETVVLFTECSQERQWDSGFQAVEVPQRHAIVLTDDLLLYYKRCRRRAFLDLYGNPTQQDPEQDFLLKLRQDSLEHQRAVIALAPHESPDYPRGDWDAGAKATVALMQQGVERISQGVLLMPMAEGVTLLSRPDLLVKQPGQSIFGDWMYAPINIKLGRRPKQEYQIVTAYSAQLLAAVQGVLPSTGSLILRSQSSYSVKMEKWIPLMQEVLSECIQTLVFRQEPELFISRQKCGLCRWHSSCHAIAQRERHLSLLPGVTPARYRELQELGVTTVESLAESEISTLESAVGREVASALVQQAQSTLQNRPMLRQQTVEFAGTFESFLPNNKLPTASVELYFDIEAQPELPLDYLLGILVVDRRNQTETFHALLADEPQDEALIWQQFLDLVQSYPEAPIFHFADYEVETVKRLARLYRTSYQPLQPLLSRFVDMHQRVLSTVMLPVESYSLKHLARWLGFEWRDPEITGSKCVCLYDEWLETRDRSLLTLIQRYNEDDCRATYVLKNWLADFLQNNPGFSD
ncbi:MAG TPA: TM0106 family RecB-like putative nuclease [Coleofasciculaceae cyanobacterium]